MVRSPSSTSSKTFRSTCCSPRTATSTAERWTRTTTGAYFASRTTARKPPCTRSRTPGVLPQIRSSISAERSGAPVFPRRRERSGLPLQGRCARHVHAPSRFRLRRRRCTVPMDSRSPATGTCTARPRAPIISAPSTGPSPTGRLNWSTTSSRRTGSNRPGASWRRRTDCSTAPRGRAEPPAGEPPSGSTSPGASRSSTTSPSSTIRVSRKASRARFTARPHPGSVEAGKVFRMDSDGAVTVAHDFFYDFLAFKSEYGPLLRTTDGALCGVAGRGGRDTTRAAFTGSCRAPRRPS